MSSDRAGSDPRYFTATLLLEKTCALDIDRVARAVAVRFPGIGQVDALPGQSADQTGVLTLDHAQIVLQAVPRAISADAASPPLRILRAWDPSVALARHGAQISVTCGGRLPGVEGAHAYAAATHFVATALAGIVAPLAVAWDSARQLIEPGEFAISAESLLAGTTPVTSWLSFAPVVPEGVRGMQAVGMVTYGLRPFIGRELELAPRPGDARLAYRCLGAVARRIIQGGMALRDGLRLVDPAEDLSMIVRERRYWLRRDESVFVLVADDALIDPWTLDERDLDVA